MLRKLLVMIVLLFPSPALAEEITMSCTYDNHMDRGKKAERIHRYVKTFIGSNKILNRVDGEWLNWGTTKNRGQKIIESKLKTTDRGAVLRETLQPKLIRDAWGLKKGATVMLNLRYVLDFEFFKRTVYWYKTHMNEAPLRQGIEGLDSERPFIEEWSCKKHEP